MYLNVGRQSIFIFLSNTGGRIITKTVLDAWNAGTKREDLSYHDFEEMVSKGAFNEQGGLHLSDVIGVSYFLIISCIILSSANQNKKRGRKSI